VFRFLAEKIRTPVMNYQRSSVNGRLAGNYPLLTRRLNTEKQEEQWQQQIGEEEQLIHGSIQGDAVGGPFIGVEQQPHHGHGHGSEEVVLL
jgi:hypothetical protein